MPRAELASSNIAVNRIAAASVAATRTAEPFMARED
jgi:hypothetical protein